MGLIGLTGIFILVLIGLGILLIPMIFFILTMQKALRRCAPENQVMSPGAAWLMIIPVFNLAWGFVLVTQMASSLEREFARRRIPVEPAPGKSIGLAWCILVLCGFIPLLGIPCVIAALVCWILYWVKIAGFSATLAAPLQALPQPVA